MFSSGCQGMIPGGFPHSGTPGSKAVCASPGVSPLAAPFFGFLRQGIRRAPLISSLSRARSKGLRFIVALRLSFLLDLSVRNYPYVLSDEPGGVPPGSDSHRCRVDRTLEDERGPVIACSEVRTAMVSIVATWSG